MIYPWLRFVRGVINSEDLPLNISREMLQNNPVVAHIRSGVTKRILSDLATLAEKDETAFETFWYQFGMVIKEGLYDAIEHRDDIFNICRFFSSNANRKLTSLDSYISRMKDGQDEIYYILGEKLKASNARRNSRDLNRADWKSYSFPTQSILSGCSKFKITKAKNLSLLPKVPLIWTNSKQRIKTKSPSIKKRNICNISPRDFI